ncbi:hypothetical protein MJO29_016914 [Puccinia striiformis f. sp. tritici]|uniref:Uncharacterized protein n=1 Tax=Puccinia striiformis f. sp. tritici PST-78 TaxID=1165861 RepID=A0A0L0VNU4_9BASI|nr:hypothetical protein Pst134EB_005965 [Puccinia striiformis f. sp. tritici]KAI7933352.1 hypothetical protein MJO29_016914 [Puccinia striiformis f. sp. tritici]KNF00882.1 hypothetical protein PSTG_05774 [Puccinia striiformis f. sp. tritici PST-78]
MVDKRAPKISTRGMPVQGGASTQPEGNVGTESSFPQVDEQETQTSRNKDSNYHSADRGVAENRESPDSVDDDFVELLKKAPEISAEQREKALNASSIPSLSSNDVEKEKDTIWKKIQEAQNANDEVLARILLKAYGDLDNSILAPSPIRPSLTKTSSANPVLLTVAEPETTRSETETEDGVIYAVGMVSSLHDVGFVPYFDENIRKMRAPLPLTIFDREWQKKALAYHIQFRGTRASDDKTYKGLPWLSEWTQTHSKWTTNHRSFYLTLRDVYGKVIFAAKLLKHKENCDAIADQYGFMTAFRYDLQVRHNTFVHRVPSKDGAAVQDIMVRQEPIIELCYTTARSNGETNWTDNYYAPGGSHSMIDPDTGRPNMPARSQSHDVRGAREIATPLHSHVANYGSAQHYQTAPFGFVQGPLPQQFDNPYHPGIVGNYDPNYNPGLYNYGAGSPSYGGASSFGGGAHPYFPGPPQGPRKRTRGYQGTNFKDGYVDKRATKKDDSGRGVGGSGSSKK